jgi:DNA-binding XRE family transcriptional regulator
MLAISIQTLTKDTRGSCQPAGRRVHCSVSWSDESCTTESPTLRINRAQVLTQWAAGVAERFGLPRDTALTVGKALAGMTTYSKGVRLGIHAPPEVRPREPPPPVPEGATRVHDVVLLGRQIHLADTAQGQRAVSKGKLVNPESVERYLRGKFGESLKTGARRDGTLGIPFPGGPAEPGWNSPLRAAPPRSSIRRTRVGAKGVLGLARIRALSPRCHARRILLRFAVGQIAGAIVTPSLVECGRPQSLRTDMPNIGLVLKEEIIRLSRRESRSRIDPTKKATIRQRREVAELKRQVAQLARQVALLSRKALGAPAAVPANAQGEPARFSARGLRVQRERLGLSAEDFGKLLGVSAPSIYNWEHEKARPRAEQLAKVAVLRGMGKREAKARLDQLGAAKKTAKPKA